MKGTKGQYYSVGKGCITAAIWLNENSSHSLTSVSPVGQRPLIATTAVTLITAKKSYTSTLDVLKKVVEILFGSEIRMNSRVVDDVIAHVDVAELVEGRKPDAVDAKTLDVIQFRLNSWKSNNNYWSLEDLINLNGLIVNH